jgi:hypothetical protein
MREVNRMSWKELDQSDIYDLKVKKLIGPPFDSVESARTRQIMCCDEGPPDYLVKFQIEDEEPPESDGSWYAYTCGDEDCRNNYEMFPDNLEEVSEKCL